jgi:23S rRNA-/tRNA-specific pseudouridylate synthase
MPAVNAAARSVAEHGKGKGGGDAKSAKTIVRVLRREGSGGGGRALVMCQPVTGRTHQIRLHLQVRGEGVGGGALKGFDV